jgi:serine/threonine protein kinase
VNWTSDSKGDKVVTDVALGDFDFACELKEREIRLGSHAVGNVMWRSPEAHTGMSSRESDIYSLGLVVSPASIHHGKQNHVRV